MFRIRQEPKEPKRETIVLHNHSLGGCGVVSLETVVGLFPDKYRKQLNKIYIETDHDHWCDYFSVEAEVRDLEPDETYGPKLQEWEVKHEAWQKWIDENREAVDVELARRADAKLNKKAKKDEYWQKEIDRLQKLIDAKE